MPREISECCSSFLCQWDCGSNYSTSHTPKTRSMIVGVLCLSEKQSIEKWLAALEKEVTVVFHKLESDDLITFTPPENFQNVEAVIVIHPVDTEGRLSITDVKEARYELLLETLNKQYREHARKKGVCLICYRVENFEEETRDIRLDNLKINQPKTFDLTDGVILCEKLENMLEKDLDEFCSFLKENCNKTLISENENWWDDDKSMRLKNALNPPSLYTRYIQDIWSRLNSRRQNDHEKSNLQGDGSSNDSVDMVCNGAGTGESPVEHVIHEQPTSDSCGNRVDDDKMLMSEPSSNASEGTQQREGNHSVVPRRDDGTPNCNWAVHI